MFIDLLSVSSLSCLYYCRSGYAWKRHKHQHSARQLQSWRCGSSWRKPSCRSVALVCCASERVPLSEKCSCPNTLSLALQIPPPKPPPPEMHFIPNPSNTEFIYLLGLEHVVDYITKDQKTPPPPDAFKCSQCQTDFTPVWKWEKNPTKGERCDEVTRNTCVQNFLR